MSLQSPNARPHQDGSTRMRQSQRVPFFPEPPSTTTITPSPDGIGYIKETRVTTDTKSNYGKINGEHKAIVIGIASVVAGIVSIIGIGCSMSSYMTNNENAKIVACVQNGGSWVEDQFQRYVCQK